MKSEQGFSLIELLIVVAIFGILVAIAIPSYTSYRRSANRSEARTSLLEISQELERYFVRQNTYVDNVNQHNLPRDSPHGIYRLRFAAGFPTATTYTLEATPQGAQLDDAECGTLSIDHLGNKQPAGCW
ncbi:MAG: type IV pilin protein [Deltaproteobacteria bacterium]|nr:type IV pilin protein [Deltaproteobacteria bacterium]